MLEVERNQTKQDRQRHLPGALFPTRESARGNEKHQTEWRNERFRHAVDVLGGKRSDQGRAVVRQHCVEDPQHPDSCNEPRQHERASGAVARAAACTQCTRKSRKRCRQVDRLLCRGGMEGLVRRNLTYDQQRKPRRDVRPAADAEGEHQTSREPLGSACPRDQPQQQSSGDPHGEKDEQRDCGAPRELIEWKRVAHRRARQRGAGLGHVQPTGRSRDDCEGHERGCYGPRDPKHAPASSML